MNKRRRHKAKRNRKIAMLLRLASVLSYPQRRAPLARLRAMRVTL
jgi:hypothetical protein